MARWDAPTRDAMIAAERNRREMKERERRRSEEAMAKLEARDRAQNPQDYPSVASAETRERSVAETSVGAGAASRQRAMGLAGQLDAGYATRSTPNKMYPHVEEFVGEKRRIMGEQPQVLDAKQSAERQAAADLQEHTARVADYTAAHRVDAQAKAFVQAEEVAAALEARRAAQGAVKEATDSFQRAQEINPDGFWQTRTKGQKARALIGNLIAGFGGQSIIPDLQNAAREHTEAAKANLAKREKLVGMREGEARDAAEIYHLTLEKVGDARAADLIMERAWMADAAAQWDRLAAQAGARALGPEQQAQRLALDDAIATMDLQIDQIAATNVKAFKQRVDLLGKETRRAARKQIDADIKLGSDLTTGAVDQAGKMEIEQLKAQQPDQSQIGLDRRHDEDLLKDYGTKVTPVETTINIGQNMLDDFARTGDVGGMGYWTPWGVGQRHEVGEDARRWQRRAGLYRENAVTDLTGAVSSEQQQKLLDAFDNAQSEGEFITAVKDIQQALVEKKKAISRAYPKRVIDAYAQTAEAPRQGPNVLGLTGRVDRDPEDSGVVEED